MHKNEQEAYGCKEKEQRGGEREYVQNIMARYSIERTWKTHFGQPYQVSQPQD